MGRTSVLLDMEDEEIIDKIQEDLPKNERGHRFSKEIILRFFVQKALRDEKYTSALYEKYYKI